MRGVCMVSLLPSSSSRPQIFFLILSHPLCMFVRFKK